jgi:hypothetical protein
VVSSSGHKGPSNIEILCANSSQAKGRVERVDRTLQDRSGKELRLSDISDMSAGNASLPGLMKQFNETFSLPAVKAENLHLRVNLPAPRLADILCRHEQRHVGQQLTLAYDRKHNDSSDTICVMQRSHQNSDI